MFSKKSYIFVCLIIIIVFITSICMYRTNTRKIIDASINDIRIEKVDKYVNSAIPESKREALLQNLNDYSYIVFSIKTKNISDKYRVTNLYIHPVFSDDMAKLVYWYDSTDELTDNVGINTRVTNHHERRIIVKNNHLSDSELIRIASSTTFTLTYNTIKNSSLFSMWHSKQVVHDNNTK